ncbi:hypothetical protein, partial [Shewanella sp. 10N.286.51.B7]|uniref:hypothetical protein n=1 Tax=Shewanella sp. 10N.286.51.B7 TaxID=1880836 RepID=UPI001A7E1201
MLTKQMATTAQIKASAKNVLTKPNVTIAKGAKVKASATNVKNVLTKPNVTIAKGAKVKASATNVKNALTKPSVTTV